MQPLAEALVSGNCGLDQFPGEECFSTQIRRDFDQRGRRDRSPGITIPSFREAMPGDLLSGALIEIARICVRSG